MRIPREWHRVWGELERAELTRQATAELTRLGELDIGICMCVLMNVCEMRILEYRPSLIEFKKVQSIQITNAQLVADVEICNQWMFLLPNCFYSLIGIRDKLQLGNKSYTYTA